ncbi:HAD superfamily phosphoserine phosphatase-like hydrolase [Peptoniphilus olsenii]|uniref:HAD superfamily phosphoserine phosphatase-like hydrolase n=1 Tax=Peptoniphilus olsenii TaxID=411570 RepID=A0ABV2J8C8_9FIRM
MKKQVILYDFDKTLIDSESIILLWKYALQKRRISYLQIPIKALSGSFDYLTKRDFKYVKNSMVSVLKYLSENDLRDFVLNYLYPNHFYVDGKNEFAKHDKNAIKILCSASATNYLKYVGEIYDFDHIIGTNLDHEFRVESENNKRKVKVNNIKEYLILNKYEIDYENSRAYSDSFKDDRYMLELVKNRFLINSDIIKKGYENLTWR